MEWNEWKPLYGEIVEKLSIDSMQDYRATEILSELIIDIDSLSIITRIERKIRNQDVVVFGSGPSLESHIEYIMDDPVLSKAVFVAADGATSALVQNSAKCDLIVSDLDGDMNDILGAIDNGAIAVVHAHGDNIPLITKYVPKMSSLLGSTQVEPLSNVFLWGGFTDGDRACYLVSHYAPSRIILAGMDFGDTVGRWSKPNHTSNFPASSQKRIKLDIAQSLLTRLWTNSGIPHFDLLSR